MTLYFSGRKKELCTLKNILDEYNSAAITQYGGAGKKQLMSRFAEMAEKKSWVTGGTYWLYTHGKRDKLIYSIARFVVYILNVPIDEHEKKDWI